MAGLDAIEMGPRLTSGESVWTSNVGARNGTGVPFSGNLILGLDLSLNLVEDLLKLLGFPRRGFGRRITLLQGNSRVKNVKISEESP